MAVNPKGSFSSFHRRGIPVEIEHRVLSHRSLEGCPLLPRIKLSDSKVTVAFTRQSLKILTPPQVLLFAFDPPKHIVSVIDSINIYSVKFPLLQLKV